MINLTNSNNDNLCKRLVVVDGIPGCGKTMLSSIISSLSRIEMLKYSYEVEIYCHLHDLKVLDLNSASQLIKNQLDCLIYNSMMGREMNFRYSDISSVFKSRNKIKNIKRIFSKGDEAIPQKIEESKPILHLATHGLTGIGAPLFQAISKGMLIINLLRHPFFLLRQNIWNMKNLINSQRSFWLYYEHEGQRYPSFYLGRELLLSNANPKEKAIYFIEWFFNKQASKPPVLDPENYYEITFESLVQDPYTHIDEICRRLDIQKTTYTKKILRRENIPREILSDGRARKIYKRVGWVKSNSRNLSEEFEEQKQWAYEGISSHAAETLTKICQQYEEKCQTL